LDDSEIDRLVKEAAENAKKDKENKERAEAKIEADSLTFQVDKFIDEMKDKLDDAAKEELKKLSEELKGMISKDDYDVEAVKTKTKELSTKLQEKGADMYKKASEEAKAEQDAKAAQEGSTENKDSEPTEGEVIDKDDKKE
jgi:molecular chaperone DnaK